MNDINQFHAELPQEQYEQGYAESDTPETDIQTTKEAESFAYPGDDWVSSDFARKLERERDELKSRLEWDGVHTCSQNCQRHMCKIRRERDEARGVALFLWETVATDVIREPIWKVLPWESQPCKSQHEL